LFCSDILPIIVGRVRVGCSAFNLDSIFVRAVPDDFGYSQLVCRRRDSSLNAVARPEVPVRGVRFQEFVRGVRKTLEAVDGDLLVENGSVEAPKSGLRVSGLTKCRGDCRFIGDVSTGSLESRGGEVFFDGNLSAVNEVDVRGELAVRGDLKAEALDARKRVDVHGALDVQDVSIAGSLTVDGVATARKADIGGSLQLGSDASLDRIDVGGSAEVRGAFRSERMDVGGRFVGLGKVVSDDIDVGGSFEAGEVEVGKLDVGGTATIGGGRIDRKVDVGGVFRAKGPLRFGVIDVGGVASMAGGYGEDITVGGKFDSEGSLTFNRLRVGGAASIKGDAVGRNVKIGGLFHVAGKIKLEEELAVGGFVEAGGTIEADFVNVGGSVKAESIVARRSIESHKIRTTKGAKADRIEIGRRGEASGPLVGREVIVQRGAYVEDVWGDRVILLRGARARNVYAGVLEAERESDVTGSILFTGELHAERGCRFTAQPAKAEKLPDRPI